ncbi:MAG TPA: ABC transporter substrate-binding protein [Stellaceae bacterium]|nr:ABC transporter substrate-binding protein [Stellaceae bacterium]
MRRRDLIVLIGGVAALRPLAGVAQPAKAPIVGVLVMGNPKPDLPLRIFREKLRDLGYVEGQNIRIEVRSAEGDARRLPELAAGLIRQKIDVLVAWQTPVVLAAERATHDIPVVMMGAGDPVGNGLVASLARPGGNITGVSGVTAELAGKHVELLKELLPSIGRIAALCNAPDPFSTLFLEHVQLSGKALGIEIVATMVEKAAELDGAFATMSGEQVGAVVVQPSLPLKRAADLALSHHLPAVSPLAPFPRAGGLMAYTAQAKDYYGRAAIFVDKILKGAKPADLPVEQPTKFELIVNLKTAKALGLTLPPTLLARADEVIE